MSDSDGEDYMSGDDYMVDGEDGEDYTYNDEDFGYGDNQDTVGAEIQRQKSYEVYSEEKLLSMSKEVIDNIVDFLGLPTKTSAAILLHHFSWNKEKLIQEYTTGDTDKIQKEAGLTSLDLEKKLDKNDLEKKMECLICLDEVPGKDTYALGCGHRYCKNCWRAYLELKVNTDATCVWTRCPHPKCNAMVHDVAFKDLLSEDVYIIYQKFVHKSFVEDNPHIKFCPAPNCTNAVKVDRKNRKEAVECGCGFRWCFQCSDFEVGDHMPATCENVEAWAAKASDESENIRWMIANTKKCPTCRKPIEKNGGCMHMTCRKESGGCGHEFCWLCRGSWKDHGSETGGFYSCNKYEGSKVKEEDNQAQALKTELETYMFYFHRYESHHKAMKIADEQRRSAEHKATEILEKFTVRAQDTIFLKEATEQLINNRRVLKWSYVYGFYLDKTKESEKNLFEYLQEDLEKHTNHLSGLYETNLFQIQDYHAFIKWKEQVTNYTRVTAGFLAKFVEGVMGGLTTQD